MIKQNNEQKFIFKNSLLVLVSKTNQDMRGFPSCPIFKLSYLKT